MDLRKLKTILELFEESNINELEISSGEETVRLSRGGQASSPPLTTVTTKSDIAKTKEESSVSQVAGNVVTSPMVGTFYRASAPDRPPFVRVGDRVEAGQTICIIEAMKLMNEIPSPSNGIVRSILAENDQAIAYGDGLFIIE